MAKPMIQFKAIKPPKFSTDQLYLMLEGACKGFSKTAVTEFKKTSRTWKDKPTFEFRYANARSMGSGQQGAYVHVWTNHQKWNWANEGTRPHVIRARRAPMLVFAVGGRPKTKPGRIAAGPGKKGNKVIRKKAVQHPGGKARDFTGQITEKLRPVWNRTMRAAWLKGTEADRMWGGRR